MLGPLDLELQLLAITWVLEIEPGSSEEQLMLLTTEPLFQLQHWKRLCRLSTCAPSLTQSLWLLLPSFFQQVLAMSNHVTKVKGHIAALLRPCQYLIQLPAPLLCLACVNTPSTFLQSFLYHCYPPVPLPTSSQFTESLLLFYKSTTAGFSLSTLSDLIYSHWSSKRLTVPNSLSNPVFCLFAWFDFWQKVSLCSYSCPGTHCRPGWPRTHRDLPALCLPSAGIKDMSYHPLT